MDLLPRFAMREVLVRWHDTVLVAALVAAAVTSVLVTASVGRACLEARHEALLPLLAAGVDVVVSTVAPATSSADAETREIDIADLAPGTHLTYDEVETYALAPLDPVYLSRLLSAQCVRDSSAALVVRVNRTSCTVPLVAGGSIETTAGELTIAGLQGFDDGLLDEGDLIAGSLPADASADTSGYAEAAVSRLLADDAELSIGDRITVADRSFVVRGIVEPRIELSRADVYLPFAEVSAMTGVQEPNVVVIAADGPGSVAQVVEIAQDLFPSATVYEPDAMSTRLVGALGRADRVLQSYLPLLAVAILAGALLSVSVSLAGSIEARRADVGTLLALGWSRAHVVLQLVCETACRTALGVIVGIGAAGAVNFWVTRAAQEVAVQIISPIGEIESLSVRLTPTLSVTSSAETALCAVAATMTAALVVAHLMVRRPVVSLLVPTTD